ncbi:MAG: Uma2 family endonuclease [Pyrinomonadaceae bacterium]
MAANVSLTKHYWALEEYFALEKGGDRRYEYWDGEIVCMSGGSREHGTIAANLHWLVYGTLVGKGCVAYTEGQAVKANVTASGYVYPDVSAACSPIFERHEERGIDMLTNPILIAEITSTDSGIRDHNRKREAYQTIQTMCDYLIIEPDSVFVTHYLRATKGWKKRIYDNLEDDTIELVGINRTLTIRDIYKGAGPAQSND